mmetsp:Transcript_3551/g.6179  ORF Transcript_3551/g.6179 Transcript_3551/m.6179 type:complete len:88 (-) Transcript_3551:341-604(-)
MHSTKKLSQAVKTRASSFDFTEVSHVPRALLISLDTGFQHVGYFSFSQEQISTSNVLVEALLEWKKSDRSFLIHRKVAVLKVTCDEG